MAEWIEDKYELDRIRVRARDAMEKAQSILKECELTRAYVPYLNKKVAGLREDTDYFAESLKGAESEVLA